MLEAARRSRACCSARGSGGGSTRGNYMQLILDGEIYLGRANGSFAAQFIAVTPALVWRSNRPPSPIRRRPPVTQPTHREPVCAMALRLHHLAPRAWLERPW